MKRRFVGQVVKGVGGVYTVSDGESTIKCYPRGKLRRQGEIYIGDMVEVECDKEGIIESVKPRKSCLVRPYVANIDAVIIVIAPVPKPDFTLVDKLLIGSLEQGIEAFIVINKCELDGAKELEEYVRNDYRDQAEIFATSVDENIGIQNLCKRIGSMFVCMAGQSGVGKSSILNALLGEDKCAIGDISVKSARGRHTTRHVEIFRSAYGGQIADTCGFSMLEMPVIDPAVLREYYPDFEQFAQNCKYRDCRHDCEEDCGVRSAASEGKLSGGRYERYLKLYKDAVKRWNNRYGNR